MKLRQILWSCTKSAYQIAKQDIQYYFGTGPVSYKRKKELQARIKYLRTERKYLEAKHRVEKLKSAERKRMKQKHDDYRDFLFGTRLRLRY